MDCLKMSSKTALILSVIYILAHMGQMLILVSQVRIWEDHVLQNTMAKVVATSRPAATYNEYLKTFNKTYSNSEKLKRFNYFKKSLKDIYRLNKESGATHGWTKFSDMSVEELLPRPSRPNLRTCGQHKRNCVGEHPKCNPSDYHDEIPPKKFDWREKGVVGPVLDQKLCNGCWAFSIVGVMESMAVIDEIEPFVRRSIQELLDCPDPGHGCKGGHVADALNWYCRHPMWGVVTEEEYPLRLANESCGSLYEGGRHIKQYCILCDVNERDILRLVAFHGPVMVVVNANPWLNYIDGIIQMACFRSRDGATMDHVVQVVGYDLTGDIPYYIIRNSWGEDFGIGGYVKLKYGDDLCGVADEIAFLDVY